MKHKITLHVIGLVLEIIGAVVVASVIFCRRSNLQGLTLDELEKEFTTSHFRAKAMTIIGISLLCMGFLCAFLARM